MRLYHFTAKEYLSSIMREGLWKGEIPYSLTDYGDNGVWLTTSGNLTAQGWADEMPPKLELRLEFRLNRDGPKLHRWRDLANDHRVDVNWYASLDDVGGGHSDEWYVYLGKLAVRVDGKRVIAPLVAMGEISS